MIALSYTVRNINVLLNYLGGFVQTSRKSQIVVCDCSKNLYFHSVTPFTEKKEFSLSEMAFAQPRGRSAHSTVVYNNHLYV